MAAIFLSRSLLRRLAQGVVGLLLFAQFAVSAQACMLPQPSPAHAFGDAMAAEDCEGVPMPGAACLAQCLKDDQANSSADFHFHVVLPAVRAISADMALRSLDPSAASAAVRYSSNGPPLQVLFCSFQT